MTARTEFRFPGETIVEIEPAAGTGPQVGYGWDYRAVRGARAGVEVTTGGTASAGPRLFAKAFLVWAPRR